MKQKKKLLRKVAALFFLLLGLGSLSACAVESDSSVRVYNHVKSTKTITWGVKYDTALFGIKSVKTNKLEGFEIDLARLLTKKILGKNGKAKFIEVTAQTKIPQLKNNNLDAVLATMTITDERKKSVDFSTPYFKAGTSLMTKTSSSIKSIKDLNHKGRVVIVVKGTTAAEDIARLAPKAKIRQYNDYGACTNALLAGQGDAVATDNGILAG
ncbi:transporter substrate-binding domain-containing protein, partial [Lactobacillus nasalidis]